MPGRQGQGVHVPCCVPGLMAPVPPFTSPLPVSPSLPPAWTREAARCTSSEEDTDADGEGLRRRRRGWEPRAPQPVGPLGVEDQARGEGVTGEPGVSLNMCLLGALVLLGLGVLLFSGEWCLPLGP